MINSKISIKKFGEICVTLTRGKKITLEKIVDLPFHKCEIGCISYLAEKNTEIADWQKFLASQKEKEIKTKKISIF